ncbi:type II secretion system major pseudopilin GspG [Fimbriimonas ginsengisoli]|uniref:Type II secretion system core protein G n=1 Tax=Fimbriimonas ginsengisoli Gsoil 348 TaxID=661478 RepID=A0A068NVX8_FIMGI|nr:type II secretion system major pseudopilin GspG [Fimbriimonas ginsengisoli]AIE87566.1 General secretion pathway protein G [Fimbriimonas ginsengisoli Gsoil 348]
MKKKINGMKRRGFTLIELLVVILILAILAALIVPKVIGRTDDAKVGAAKSDLKNLSSALEAFKLDCGRYPTADEGLTALQVAPGDVQGWKGPYLKGMPESQPVDPWGTAYQYEYPGTSGDPNSYTITSLGADKAQGGDGYNADLTENG